MEACYQIPCIIECFVEILAGIVARDRDILAEEISPPAISHKLAIEVDGEVGSMDLFRCSPQNVWLVETILANTLDELVPGR